MYARTVNRTFTVYPAINLRKGQVVGPRPGDPAQQTVYDPNPASVARRWVKAGAHWLHVTNLDAELGMNSPHSQEALTEILKVAKTGGARTQVAGGLDSLDQIARVLNMGYNRAVLGPIAVRQPFILAAALERWGPERVAVSLDARPGRLDEQAAGRNPLALARWFAQIGLRWLILTDTGSEGPGQQADPNESAVLSSSTTLNVIAAGEVDRIEDVAAARRNGLAGLIVNRALYEKRIDAGKLFAKPEVDPG